MMCLNEPKGFFSIKEEPLVVAETRRKILREFEDLEFYDDGHFYMLNGKKLTVSVSSIGHRFIKMPFDEQSQARRYAIKHGQTAEYWLQKWKENSFRATTIGTKIHEYGESLGYLLVGFPELIRDSMKVQYMEKYQYLAPIHPKEEAVFNFINDLPKSMHLVLNEAKVYSGKNQDASKNLNELICGTFDMLYYYDGDGDESKAGFVILDYKTNSNLYNEYNQKKLNTLKSPFGDLVEQDLSLYTIQLSLYALMLEDIGINIIDRRIVWLKDDGAYQLISVPDVSERLRKIL